ncbi:MAG: ATP-binding cassette domain-containing protein, partial [Propionibacteriaceae bacterium]|nr:ATP-binding cassette domain-containing protein [Propionibacteriaceae bacterium]
SGGQQQRVAVARALVTNPAIILADEPTGNLDSVSTNDMLGLLSELHAQGRTIILITHDQEVADTAQRVVNVRDGQITADSTLAKPKTIRKRTSAAKKDAAAKSGKAAVL